MNQCRIQENQFKPYIFYVLRKNKTALRKMFSMNLKLSSEKEDTKYSFDMIFESKLQISVRIRNNNYLNFRDFTIRTHSWNGGKTEIDKLIIGYGQIYFYAWMTSDKQNIEHYILVDIDKIRNKLADNGTQLFNNDPTGFKAYSINFLTTNKAIIDSSFDDVDYDDDQLVLF